MHFVDQRMAPTSRTSSAADTFGAVSEDNIGEFLKYMPGLTIDYVESDARTVRVRGLSSKYASVMIDGNPVAAAESASVPAATSSSSRFRFPRIDTIELSKTQWLTSRPT